MIWLLARTDSSAAQSAAKELYEHAQKQALPIRYLGDLDEPEADDILVVLGGDGTLIQAARRYADGGLRMVAINLGRLGYITSFAASEAKEALTNAAAGAVVEETRLRLQVSWGDGLAGTALNEALITSGQPGRICSLSLTIDDQPPTTLRGDGALVATPTGSTAYALSAGGPVVLPGVQALVVVPVAPHSIRFRPLVLSPSTRLTLTNEEEAWLVLDGQQRLRLDAGTEVVITEATSALRLLKPKQHDHLQILRSKLHWGEWS
jgi:NAD+ kinase